MAYSPGEGGVSIIVGAVQQCDEADEAHPGARAASLRIPSPRSVPQRTFFTNAGFAAYRSVLPTLFSADGRMKAEQVIQAPNAAELQWVKDHLQQCTELVQRYTGERRPLPSLQLLAATFRAWGEAPSEGREDANEVVNALGLAFGQHLVNAAHLAWAVVSDDQGTDIAVHGQPGDILVFPTNAIAKRCESGDYDCLPWLFEQMTADIARMRAEWKLDSGAAEQCDEADEGS